MKMSKSARKRAHAQAEARMGFTEGSRPYTEFELQCILEPPRDSIPTVQPKTRGLGRSKKVRVNSMTNVGDKIGRRTGKGIAGISTVEMSTPNTGAHVQLSERGKNAGVKRVQREAPIRARKPMVQRQDFGIHKPDSTYHSRSIVDHEVETEQPGMRIRAGHCSRPRALKFPGKTFVEVPCHVCNECIEELARP